MSDSIRPYPKNVPGPFYVVDGCCLVCDLPSVMAPGMFEFESHHCFVKRQPETKDELDRMVRTALSADLACIRYRGSTPDVLRRFAERGEAELCDVAPPSGIRPIYRSHVTFDTMSPEFESLSPTQLAGFCQSHLGSISARYQFTPIVEAGETATLAYSWFEESHTIAFQRPNLPGCRWLVRNASDLNRGRFAVSDDLHAWLKSDSRFCKIRWYSQEQWLGSKQWQEFPW